MRPPKSERIQLPRRGDWLFVRAKFYRIERSMAPVPAMQEAAADWDEGRVIGNWNYSEYAK